MSVRSVPTKKRIDYYVGGALVFLLKPFALLAGRIPQWNPTIFGGVPHFANPQVGRVEAETTVLMEISNTMVRLYKEVFGRGPTKARTHWTGARPS